MQLPIFISTAGDDGSTVFVGDMQCSFQYSSSFSNPSSEIWCLRAVSGQRVTGPEDLKQARPIEKKHKSGTGVLCLDRCRDIQGNERANHRRASVPRTWQAFLGSLHVTNSCPFGRPGEPALHMPTFARSVPLQVQARLRKR